MVIQRKMFERLVWPKKVFKVSADDNMYGVNMLYLAILRTELCQESTLIRVKFGFY